MLKTKAINELFGGSSKYSVSCDGFIYGLESAKEFNLGSNFA